MDNSPLATPTASVENTSSDKKTQKRTFLIIVIIVTIVLFIGGAVSYFLNVRRIFILPSQSSISQQQEYKNPFQKPQYENPFSEYQNPFEEIK